MKYSMINHTIFLVVFLFCKSLFGQIIPSDSAGIMKEYWQKSKIVPSHSEYFGAYEVHNGFGGYDLFLHTDSTFLIKQYSDIISAGEPMPGFKGSFVVRLDTLYLQYLHYDIDSSATITWRKSLIEKEAYTMQKINVQEDKRVYPNKYVFKKVKRYLFLVPPTREIEFSGSVFSPNGLPELNYSDGKTWGNDFLVKTASFAKPK